MMMKAIEIKRTLEGLGYHVLPISNKESGWHLLTTPNSDSDTYVIRDTDINHVATIEIESDDAPHVIFNGEKYDTAKALCDAIKAHNASLPLSIRYYDPLLSRQNATVCALTDYMLKIGFKSTYTDHCTEHFVLNDMNGNPLMSLKISVHKDETTHDKEDGMIVDTLTSFGSGSAKLVYAEYKDALDGIKVINSMVETKFLTDMARKMDMLEKLTAERNYSSQMTFDYADSEIKKMKSFIKKELEKSLELISK